MKKTMLLVLCAALAILLASAAVNATETAKYPDNFVSKYEILSEQKTAGNSDLKYDLKSKQCGLANKGCTNNNCDNKKDCDNKKESYLKLKYKYNALEQLKLKLSEAKISHIPEGFQCKRTKIFSGRDQKGNLEPESYRRECYKKPYKPIKEYFDPMKREEELKNLGLTYWGEEP